jgi:hypothetical protein
MGRIEVSEMGFPRPLLDISLRDNIKSTGIRKELGAELTVEEIRQCQRKWHNHVRVERMSLERLPWQVYFITLLEDGT